MQKLQVPCSYGLGIGEKWPVTQDTRHVTCCTRQVVLIASDISQESIQLFGYFQTCLSSISTYFLLKLDLHRICPISKMSQKPVIQ